MDSKTIGGFLELERLMGREYYDDALRFNIGRTALIYALLKSGYRRLMIPYYLCDCIPDTLCKNHIQYSLYHIDKNFEPVIDKPVQDDEAVLIVNYYGCFDENRLRYFERQYRNIIIDNSQAFFENGEGQIAFYTCRKWFGTADGAYLRGVSRDDEIYEMLPLDFSGRRIEHLTRKFEDSGEDLYDIYSAIEDNNINEPMKKMSKLTVNLLSGIDYNNVAEVRWNNWFRLDELLSEYNPIQIKSKSVPFMYAFYTEKAGEIRRELKQKRIFLPMLWPNVLELPQEWIENKLTKNLLLLPIDQRYSTEDMERMAREVKIRL